MIDKTADIWTFDRASFNQGVNAKYDFRIANDQIADTLVARGTGGVLVIPQQETLLCDEDRGIEL